MNIENGRVIDRIETGVMLKTALRAIVDKYGLTMVCTPNQSILFKDILPEQREGVEAILSKYNIKRIEQVKMNLQRHTVQLLFCLSKVRFCTRERCVGIRMNSPPLPPSAVPKRLELQASMGSEIDHTGGTHTN